MYDQVLANPNQYIQDPRGEDPNYGVRRLQEFEKSLRQRRIQEKLQSVVASAVRVTDGEIRQKFADQNQRYDALYALFDPNTMVKEGDVAVTDADLREYYEENADQYKIEASRKLKYVLFLENPTAADSAARETEIRDAASKANSGVDFLQLVYTYSDRPDSGAFFRRGELGPAVENAVFAGKVGAVIGPVADNDGYHLFKMLEERTSASDYVHASHILLPVNGPDSMAVRATAQTVARLAREGKNFADLARQYSKDPSSAERGGDLGWFTKGRMVAPFEAAAFKAKAGEIVGPVRTPFGIHIIKVHGRDNREIKLAHIDMKIAAGSQTKNDIADRAKDFSYNSKESDFTQEVQQTGLEAKETQVLEKGGVVPGIGINESITRWAFGAKVGSVSEPYTITNGYAVFTVVEVKNAGVRPFDEVKESISSLALRKKKLDAAKKLASDARARLSQGDSLTRLSALVPGVTVQSTGSFTLAGSIPGVGRDQAFIGTVAGLQPGQISPAVGGARGAYVIQVLSRTEFDSVAFASQRDVLLARTLQEKRSRFLSDWLAKLKENADIEDHRDIFFR
jgi:peptidylprolyl isomerase/peptidyl-prolyl cis-trans isomerase D